jgi:hypothetical protein
MIDAETFPFSSSSSFEADALSVRGAADAVRRVVIEDSFTAVVIADGL